MNTAAEQPEQRFEELEKAFEEQSQALNELVIHFDRTVGHLEQATRLIAKQGQQQGEAIGWLRDIRHAAGATGPDISHQHLCQIIQDLRRRAFVNEATQMRRAR